MPLPIENIEELEADDLLREALASGGTTAGSPAPISPASPRSNEVGLIRWKKDKTNRDYLTELYDKELYYEGVRRLTLAYEIVWYGERSVSTDSFQKLSSEFESVNSQILQFKPTFLMKNRSAVIGLVVELAVLLIVFFFVINDGPNKYQWNEGYRTGAIGVQHAIHPRRCSGLEPAGLCR